MRLAVLTAAALSLTACAGTTPRASGVSTVSVAESRSPSAARYKIGAPYQVGGVWYVPADQPGYEAVGAASWYGPGYRRRSTADGEPFDDSALTGAHPTLPLPSLVEVTNLDNGRTLQVRLNDRGAFRRGRVIDLSRTAATRLGFMAQGTARVRVRYLGPAPLDPGATPQQAMPHDLDGAPAMPGRSVDAARVGGFAVQVGAFADRGRAERVASRLSGSGPARVRPLERDGSPPLFRVVVGPWADGGPARSARARIAALGFGDAKVVQAF